MLLEDAKSEEEVAEVLAGSLGQKEATELREDIEDKLDDVVRWYGRHGGEACEYEDFDLADAVVDNEQFLEAIIEQSPSEYDLRLLDRGVVQKRINHAAARSYRNHGTPTSARCSTGVRGDMDVPTRRVSRSQCRLR